MSCPGSVRAGERGTGLRRGGGRRRVEHGILLARARLCGGRQVPSDVSRSTRAAEAVGGALDDRLGATSLIAAEDGLLVSTSFDGAKRLRWAHMGGKIGRGELTARREARGRDEETERRQSVGEVVDGDGRGWGGLGEVRGGRTRANKAPDSDSGAGHSLLLPCLFGRWPLLLPEHRAAGSRASHSPTDSVCPFGSRVGSGRCLEGSIGNTGLRSRQDGEVPAQKKTGTPSRIRRAVKLSPSDCRAELADAQPTTTAAA